jgi:hypothetical protein
MNNLILILILIQGFSNIIFASHFRYGSITWTPLSNGTNLGLRYVVLSLTTSWGWRSDYDFFTGCNYSVISSGKLMGATASIYCSGCNLSNIVLTDSSMYCTGFSPASAENWSFGYRTQTLTINLNSSSVEIYFNGTAWENLVPINNADWMVKAKLNLQVRPDNGLINTSPVLSSYPTYCVRQGYIYTIIIPIVDLNDDDLRCRWATNSTLNGDECAGICGIIKSISTLTYTRSSAGTQCFLKFRGDLASYGKYLIYLNYKYAK